ncbi:MAG: transporter substrate-binding domain-containing protein [Actinomycetota bacterium]|nr:transporter substrate-binding domain-containing protein [Actinomycetota bacterium]
MSRTLLALAAALGLATGCVPPAEGNDQILRYDEVTRMGQIQARGELIVAIPELPGFASTANGKEPEGFMVDLSREVADALGVSPRFVPTLYPAPADHAFASVDIGSVDISFAPFAITEALAREHKFATPFFVAHQRLLAAPGRGALEDLSGEPVCQSLEPGTGLSLERLDPKIRTRDATIERCTELLLARRVTAITASDLFLIGAARQARAPLGTEELTTEAFAPAVPLGAGSFGTFVSAVIVESKLEGRWMGAYERWLAPAFPEAERLVEPPSMTLSEAAALHPQDLD